MKINFVFFGGEPLAVPTLEKLKENGLLPSLIIANPDKPQGRNLEVLPPPTAIWAKEHNIPLFQPDKLSDPQVAEKIGNPDLFVVVSYGQIIPKSVLDLSKNGSINIHPSLLPKYRGPSPIVSAILNGDEETGVSIMLLDDEMDHGPILAQEKIKLNGDEMAQDLEKTLAELGGEMLVKAIPGYLSGEIKPVDQDHAKATFVAKFSKEDMEIDPNGDQIVNWRKFRAYPKTFFFKDGVRHIVKKARFENDKFIVERVIPENGKEQDYHP